MGRKNKKSSNINFDKLIDSLLESMSCYNSSEAEENANDSFENGYVEYMNEIFYSYDRPNYAAKAHDVNDYLMPLYTVEKLKDVPVVCDAAEKIMQTISPEEREADVRNYLFNLLADAPKKHRRNPGDYMQLYAVFKLMETFDMTSLSDIVIELLRQDMHFFAIYFNGMEDAMSLLISKICRKDLPSLKAYMFETGRIPGTKCIVCDAVVQIVIDHPERRLEVMAWFSGVLSRYAEIRIVESNIDYMVHSLSQIKAYELCGVLQKVYDAHDIPSIYVTNGMVGVKKMLKSGMKNRIIINHSIKEIIDDMAANYDENRDYNKEFDDAMRSLLGINRNDDDEKHDDDDDEKMPSFIKEENDDGKRFVLDVKLMGGPFPIERRIEVPSAIRLNCLARVLRVAMGWDGEHSDHFLKGKKEYVSPQEMKDNGFGRFAKFGGLYCNSEFSLNEVIYRKNMKMTWEYDYDISWKHEISIVETRKDNGKGTLVELISGQNACPPDDCDGFVFYEYLLDVYKDSSHPDHNKAVEWLNEDFDPYFFDAEATREQLKKMSRKK